MRVSQEAQIKYMLELRKRGYSNQKIAQETHRKESTVAKYIGSKNWKCISQDAIKKAKELESKGVERREIGRITGMSASSIRKYLGKKKRSPITKHEVARMYKLRRLGYSYEKIGRILGINDRTVYKHICDGGNVKEQTQQLCWTCARSAAGKDKQCSWDARLQPVEGWTVDEAGFVVSCPEFEEVIK